MTSIELREAMEREGFTIKALSNATGISVSTIKWYRANKVPKNAEECIMIALGYTLSHNDGKPLRKGVKTPSGVRFGADWRG